MGARAFPESLQRLSTEPCCVSEDSCSSSALYASYSVLLFVLNVSTRTELGPLLCMSKPGSPDVIVLFSTPYCVLVLPLPPSHQELFQNRLLTPCRLLVSEPGKQTAERRETRTGSNQTKADEIKSPVYPRRAMTFTPVWDSQLHPLTFLPAPCVQLQSSLEGSVGEGLTLSRTGRASCILLCDFPRTLFYCLQCFAD